MTVVLILRRIPVDPGRREDEVFDEVTPDTDWGFHPGTAFPRTYDCANADHLAHHRAIWSKP